MHHQSHAVTDDEIAVLWFLADNTSCDDLFSDTGSVVRAHTILEGLASLGLVEKTQGRFVTYWIAAGGLTEIGVTVH